MTYKIIKESCFGCGGCVNACALGAIKASGDGKYEIDTELCAKCGICLGICPAEAIVAE